ncbi:MAG: S1C family serine protease [Blautia sp.]|nr:S1C family serine protease [Blautia sp.]
MEKTQIPKNEFVREQIKNKPKNKKRLVVKLVESALCGVVFALALCLTMLVMRPVLKEREPESAETEETEKATEPAETEEPTETEQAPTVVEVPSEITLEDYQRLQNELYIIGNQANKSIVTITSVISDTDWFNNSYEREGLGSGTIIEETPGAYLILTERKVITDASRISVTFIDEAVATAELINYDGNTGIAILSVSKDALEDKTKNAIAVIPMGNSNMVHKGTMVLALGSPLGTNYSILTGNITATNNEISTMDSNYSVFTTDIVASKNGGGILINTEGELVGVVMQDYSASSASTLTALAVSEIKPVIELLYSGRGIPYLGLSVSTVTDKIAEAYGLPKGVYVKAVAMDSPAMNAGLQSGDVLVELNGRELISDRAFFEELLACTPGESYPVVIMRQGSDGYTRITSKMEPGVLK